MWRRLVPVDDWAAWVSVLRVMSANLRRGHADSDALVDLIRRLRVDAVGLQELGPAQAELISTELPHGLLSPSASAEGTGLALRKPARVVAVPTAYRPLHVAHLESTEWPGLGGPVELATTHFAAPHVRPYGSGFQTRRRQLRDIEAYLASSGAASRVLFGDFNATPVWSAYRRIASHLTDVAVELAAAQGRSPRKTWGPWPGSPRWLRLDHAFARGLRPVEFQVVALPGSDHDAIVIDFTSSG